MLIYLKNIFIRVFDYPKYLCPFFGILIILLFFSQSSISHPLSVSYSIFEVDNNIIRATYRLPIDDMDLLLQLDKDFNNNISSQELENSRLKVEKYLEQKVTVNIDGVVLETILEASTSWEDSNGFPYLQASVIYTASERIQSFTVTVGVLTDLYQDHRNLAEFILGDRQDQFVFQNNNTWAGKLDSKNIWNTVREFTLFGIEHIVTGYDHILFLMGLLLVARNFHNLVAIITSFTIAHSLTLVLATLGFINPIPWLVEAGIAFSIVYVGLENLIVKTVSPRWRITFAFGLIHGFGFAGILKEMDLDSSGLLISLFTFNLGVEIGQLAIIALTWPFSYSLSKTKYHQTIIRLLSTIIVIMGLIWLFGRLTG